MLNLESSRFDKYSILFTDTPNDIRFRLFLDVMHTNAVNNAKQRGRTDFILDDLQLKHTPIEMVVSSFIESPLQRLIKPESPIHPEWLVFFKDLQIQLQKNINNSDVLILIKSLSSLDGLDLTSFIIQLVKSMFIIKKTDTSDITINHRVWSSAHTIIPVTSYEFMNSFTQKLSSDVRNLMMMSFMIGFDNADVRNRVQKADAKEYVGTGTAMNLADITTFINRFYKLDVAGESPLKFSFNLEKLVLVNILAKHLKDNTIQPAKESSFFDDVNTVKDAGKYWRDENGILYMNSDVKGAAPVKMDPQSREFLSLVNTKCMTTNVQENGGETCASFLKGCLENGDITKCKAYLTNDKFWPDVKEEVKNIVPLVAVQLLQSFQFKTKEHYNNDFKLNVKTVETVQEWATRLKDQIASGTLNEAEVKSITSNIKLIGYLEMLVDKINSNLTILNKDIKRGATIAISDPFKGSRFSRLGVGFNPVSPLSSLVSTVIRTNQTTKENMDRLAISLSLPQTFGFRMPMILRGGSTASVEATVQKQRDQFKHTWAQIEMQYAGLVKRLNASGKTLDKNDDQKIKELIAQLKDSELKLYKAMLYTEKYADLIEVHGQQDNSSSLSLVQLQQFVDMRQKYFERVSRKQSALASIIQAVAEAVVKEAGLSKVAAPTAQNQNTSQINLNSFF
jgi:hypothetical protein